jgi:hypothetical protein
VNLCLIDMIERESDDLVREQRHRGSESGRQPSLGQVEVEHGSTTGAAAQRFGREGVDKGRHIEPALLSVADDQPMDARERVHALPQPAQVLFGLIADGAAALEQDQRRDQLKVVAHAVVELVQQRGLGVERRGEFARSR